MANMTFKASLLPNTSLGYSLGSEDKQWNIYGELNGNANSADKLKTARTLTIGETGKDFDGSADVSWSLSEIGAASSSHTHSYLPLSGGIMTGAIQWNGRGENSIYNGPNDQASEVGGTLNNLVISSWYGVSFTTSCSSTYMGKNAVSINTRTGNIYAAQFNGPLNGNASSATVLKDRTNNTLTYSNYGAAGLAASAISWLTCWNGYELRAISKAEMANAVDSSHKWVRLSGDSMTGKLRVGNTTQGYCLELWADGEGSNLMMRCAGSGGTASNTGYQFDTYNNNLRLYRTTNGGASATAQMTLMDSSGYSHFVRGYGAVWNDYAEKRNIPEAQKTDWRDEECVAHPYAGKCVREIGDDTMTLTTERLQKGCKIISDTFGYCVGETDDCKTPIAVSGRALVYLLEDRETAKEHIGDFVCSGPNGTVSIMTTEEYFKCPQAVVGTISAVPDYEEWGTGHVKVDGRIWIYVR